MRVEQLDLFGFVSSRLMVIEKEFSNRLSKEVKIILTGNRSHLITVRKRNPSSVMLRIQEIFLHAPKPVWDAICQFIIAPSPDSRRIIREFLSASPIRPAPESFIRAYKIRSKGEIYQLDEIYDAVNREYFNNEIRCRISWGNDYKRRRRRSISFGNYESFSNLIKINPALDRVFVPDYFIRYIVYHEMLHARFDAGGIGSRTGRIHHNDEFYRREKNFRDYDRAIRWERENIRLFVP